MTLKAFFKTPKGLLLILLALLVAMAVSGAGRIVWPGVVAASIAAMAVDLGILRVRDKHWKFPSGALLTGLIVAMILSPFQPWYVAAVTAVVAVVSKYLVRIHHANVFNPAALALVATYFVFQSEQSWWGALPDLPLVALVALLAGGIFITQRLHKMPSALAFLGAYYLLLTVASFIGDPAKVAELFRAPDLHAAVYFAFFMVTDPPTSPVRQRDQIIYGALTAIVAFAVFATTGAVYSLLAGVLVANVWEAWRRSRLRARRAGQRVQMA
jgi:Na+-translocating ferredoxin:NAD+ oxidoreductase RnfD subunit